MFKRGVLLAVTAGALAVPPPQSVGFVSSHLDPATPTTVQSPYGPFDLETYLTSGQTDFIRPGVNIKILSVTNVAPGQKPVVEFTLTDDLGAPLVRLGAVTPGTISPGFVFAKWDATSRYYVPY